MVRGLHIAGVPAPGTEFTVQSQPAQTRLRLTRRGRMVLSGAAALGIAVLLLVSAILFGSPQAIASSEASSTEFGYVVVAPGASLWTVATELDSSADPRDLVAELVRLNQLSGSSVQAGQPIAVPVRYLHVPGVATAAELGLS